MSTEDDMATLRRMRNARSLSAADAAALDTVDRMLRDLRVAKAVERSVSAGLLDARRRDDVLAKTETFGRAVAPGVE